MHLFMSGSFNVTFVKFIHKVVCGCGLFLLVAVEPFFYPTVDVIVLPRWSWRPADRVAVWGCTLRVVPECSAALPPSARCIAAGYLPHLLRHVFLGCYIVHIDHNLFIQNGNQTCLVCRELVIKASFLLHSSGRTTSDNLDVHTVHSTKSWSSFISDCNPYFWMYSCGGNFCYLRGTRKILQGGRWIY